MTQLSQLAPGAAGTFNRFEKLHVSNYVRQADDFCKRFHQRHVAHVRNRRLEVAIGISVANRDRDDPRLLVYRRLQ